MSKTRRLRWSMLALLFAATSISYVHRQALSVVAPVLRDELSMSNFGYARIVFAFLLSYTIMQAVTGWLIDRLGPRAGFAAIVGWWSAAAMLHAFGRDVFSFSVFRLLLGAGQAGSWAASVRAVAEWVPRQERGLANGIWGAGTSVGMIAAVPLVAWITLAAGWRWMFVLTGATGFIWLAAWLVVYRRNEDDAPAAAPRAPGFDAPEAPAEPGREISYASLLRLRGVSGSRRSWRSPRCTCCSAPTGCHSLASARAAERPETRKGARRMAPDDRRSRFTAQYRSTIAPRLGFGQRPALLIVDFARGWTDSASPMAIDLDAAVEAAAALLQRARRLSVPAFFVTLARDALAIDIG